MPRPTLKLDLSSIPRPGCSSRSVLGLDAGRSDIGSSAAFLSEYKLDKALGSGTVAVVKRAVHLVDNRQVAVKCITTDDDEVWSFAIHEYELLRSLQHPCIVAVEALYKSRCELRIVMELCVDGNLQSYVRHEGPFLEPAVTPLFQHLLEAVSFLHQRRIVHRDLKPDNLLLTQSASWLKVADFNSAKVIGQGVGSSVMLTNRGTQAYSAPELILGRNWNERIDMWASGLCLYFMVCGRLPFHSHDPKVKELFVLGETPDVYCDGLSDDLQSILRQCLAVNVHDRPPAMKVLLHPFMRQPEEEAPAGWFGTRFRLPSTELLDTIASELCCSTGRTCKGNNRASASAKKSSAFETPHKDMLMYRYNAAICCTSRNPWRAVSAPPETVTPPVVRRTGRARSASAPVLELSSKP